MPRICQDARFALTDWHGGVYTSWRMRVDLNSAGASHWPPREGPLGGSRRRISSSRVGAMRNGSRCSPVAQAVTLQVFFGSSPRRWSRKNSSTAKTFPELLLPLCFLGDATACDTRFDRTEQHARVFGVLFVRQRCVEEFATRGPNMARTHLWHRHMWVHANTYAEEYDDDVMIVRAPFQLIPGLTLQLYVGGQWLLDILPCLCV